MPRWFHLTILSLLTLFCTLLIGVSFVKFQFGLFNALDLGIFNQVFWQTTHGHFFGMTIHPHSYLGDHAGFIILLLAPVYAVISRPETLLVLQILAVASAPIPLLLLHRKTLKASRFARFLAVLLTLLWVINPYLHNAILFEFHLYPFAAPILAWTYFWYRKHHLRAFWIGFLLFLSVREDMALTTFMFSLLALLERRSWKWWLPQAIVSVGWFFGTTQLAGWINTGGSYKFLSYYTWMGEGVRGILVFMATKPMEVLRHLTQPISLKVVGLLLSSFLFLPLLAPGALVFLLPSVLVHALTESGLNQSFLLAHYQLLALTALLIAGFDALPRLTRLTQASPFPKYVQCFTGGLLLLILAFPAIQTTLHSGLFVVSSPASNLYRLPQRDPTIRIAFMEALEGTDHVMAGATFLPFLGDRETLMSLHYVYIGKKQFSEEDFPLPAVDAAVFDSDEMIRLHAVKSLAEPIVEEGIDGGSKRLRRYLENQDLHVKQTFDDLLLFTHDGTLEVAELETGNATVPEFGSADLSTCEERVCLTVTTAHPAASENVLIRLLLKDPQGETVWRSFYLPAYGLYLPAEFTEATDITTSWTLAFPPLAEGAYQLHLLLEPLKGGHPITGLRHAGFLPEAEPETLDERTIGAVIIDAHGNVVAVSEDAEETSSRFE